MYRNTTKDPVVAAVTAAIGAGCVAGFCVSQGQSVIVGIAITAFATVSALLIDKIFLK